MKMRHCVKCGRRRPMKKLTEMLDGGVWRCTYWQGRCLEGFMPLRRVFTKLYERWPRRMRRDVHRRGA